MTLLDQAPDGPQHFVMVEGLGNIIGGTQLHGVHGRANAGIAGHHQHWCIWQFFDQAGSGGAWQANIHQHQIIVRQLVVLLGLFRGFGTIHKVIIALQQLDQRFTDNLLVFND